MDRTEGHGDLDTYQCTYDGIAYTELLDWVDSVNTKMESASASSGVGVRVKVSLRDDLNPNRRTVYHLACKKSAATRTPEQDAELAAALKSLLDAADGETDTEKVKQAVDIRDWVRVDYFVHRPGQEPKRWTRNTGLSGGERRLAILSPMIVSIAALYDNLPDTALRLAALDEVPAEVDDTGREGLARYIAELDLDVICTSLSVGRRPRCMGRRGRSRPGGWPRRCGRRIPDAGARD
nr:SbcC/MukB-like Walker B domain-containing protein [Mycobacterium lepraemurium]